MVKGGAYYTELPEMGSALKIFIENVTILKTPW